MALMENFQKQLLDFAKTDSIGIVMWETANLLDGLTKTPVFPEDIENSADSLSKMRANTQKNEGNCNILNLEDLRRAYCELRMCCYGLTEAVENSIRSLITNNRIEMIQEDHRIYPVNDDLVDVKREQIEYEAEGHNEVSMEQSAEDSNLEQLEPGEDIDEDKVAECKTAKVYINPNDYCLLPKEEEEDDDVTDENDELTSSIDDLSNSEMPKSEKKETLKNSRASARTVPSNNIKVKCRICNKRMSRSNLKTGEKRYKCDQCHLA
ncbi:hypothetical protein PFISCL1PPCAC_7238, partial [Pristionchus fissidentatus]